MTSRYYSPGSERGERVRQLFARIASRYDLINDVQSFGLHRLWKARLIRAAAPVPGEQVLDVCCGTGDIAARFAAHTHPVVGCDFTPEMLANGRSRHPANVAWVQADALALPFASASFDIVTIGYGLRNLSDFRLGIDELIRVLKPGGRLLILDFGKPENILFRTLYFAYLRLLVPIFGSLFAGDSSAYQYILDSLKHYPAQRGVTELLQQSGCREVVVRNFVGGAMSLHWARKSAT